MTEVTKSLLTRASRDDHAPARAADGARSNGRLVPSDLPFQPWPARAHRICVNPNAEPALTGNARDCAHRLPCRRIAFDRCAGACAEHRSRLRRHAGFDISGWAPSAYVGEPRRLLLRGKPPQEAIERHMESLRRQDVLQAKEAVSRAVLLLHAPACFARNELERQGRYRRADQRQTRGRARRALLFGSQPFVVAEPFTALPGAYVPLAETIRDYAAIVDGRCDALPEEALSFTGALAALPSGA